MNEPPLRRRILMIVNPTAGRRRRWRIRATIAELERLGAAVIVATTSKPGEAEHFAARADQREHDLLVIAGGDGSINEAITGLGPAAPPLGILPAGTANVVAAEIGMSATPGAIARTLLNGPARTIGLGRANGRRFLTMVGAGLDAKVVAALRPELKRWFGEGAYVLETPLQLPTSTMPTKSTRRNLREALGRRRTILRMGFTRGRGDAMGYLNQPHRCGCGMFSGIVKDPLSFFHVSREFNECNK
jgi:diacylglycerol kinase family enzyme